MQNLKLAISHERELRILCLGAHCDDIEIGCGGTLLKLKSQYSKIRIKWVVFASNEIRKKEALKSASLFLEGIEKTNVTVLDYRDGFLPSVWSEVKGTFENIKDEFQPDVIFTHYREDLHQDHRTINELTWNTFRNHLILEYEIPKFDGDLGKPNLFVPLEESILEKKKRFLIESFESQLNKHWFDDVLLSSLPRIRGVECASNTRYAEAFYSRKLIV